MSMGSAEIFLGKAPNEPKRVEMGVLTVRLRLGTSGKPACIFFAHANKGDNFENIMLHFLFVLFNLPSFGLSAGPRGVFQCGAWGAHITSASFYPSFRTISHIGVTTGRVARPPMEAPHAPEKLPMRTTAAPRPRLRVSGPKAGLYFLKVFAATREQSQSLGVCKLPLMLDVTHIGPPLARQTGPPTAAFVGRGRPPFVSLSPVGVPQCGSGGCAAGTSRVSVLFAPHRPLHRPTHDGR